MKIVSTFALGMALALGTTAIVGTNPALAQKKDKKAAGQKYDLSKPVREAVSAAQTALAAGDNATTAAKLAEARAAATTGDDKFVTGSVEYELARKTNDTKAQSAAVELMLSSGKVGADQLGQFNTVVGQLAYQANDFQKAERYLQAAVDAGAPDSNVFALLVETKQKLGKTPEALQTLQAGIDKQKAAGQTVPKDWYGRGIAIGYAAKLPQQTEKLTQEWLMAYPGDPSNWRDSLITWRDLNKVDAETELDVYRLMRSAGALKGQADYMEYVNATYLRNPGEAKAVLDEGVKAGFVNTASSQNAREINTIVSGKVSADRASLPKAPAASATGKALMNFGDAYLGYADWANAATFYKAAIAKGGIDANVANIRLGQALARSGDKAGAKAAFAAVTGPRAGLARYWTIWVDQQA